MKEFTFKQNWDNDGIMEWENAKTIDRYKELVDSRNRIKLTTFDCFIAFSDKQFKEGVDSIRPLSDGEKLISFCPGGYGTSDGVDRLIEYYDGIREQIISECDPQEVYCYEYNNYESCINYDGDKEAIKLIADYWGLDVARTINRKTAYYAIEDIINCE